MFGSPGHGNWPGFFFALKLPLFMISSSLMLNSRNKVNRTMGESFVLCILDSCLKINYSNLHADYLRNTFYESI